MNNVKNNRSYGACETNNQGSERFGVPSASRSNGVTTFCLPECGNVDGSSAVGFWRSSWSNKSRLTTSDSTHLGFVNVASSMASRSRSSVSVDHSIARSNRHAPACINIIDITPGNEVIAQWVGNPDALATENYLWLDESCVVGGAQSHDHQSSCQYVSDSTFNEARPEIKGAENFHHRCDEVIAPSAEQLTIHSVAFIRPAQILHGDIFPQVSEVL